MYTYTTLDYIHMALRCLVVTAVLCVVAGAVTTAAVKVSAAARARRARNRPDDPSHDQPAVEHGSGAVQHARRITTLAWVWLLAGIPVGAVGVSMLSSWRYSMGPDHQMFLTRLFLYGPQILFTTPLAAGVGFLVVHGIGERTWARPSGATRQAVLVPRSVRSMVGQALPVWNVVLISVMVAALFGGAIGADRFDGTEIVTHRSNDGTYGGSGNWPGAPIGVPLLVSVAVLGVLTVLVLRAIARRPAVAGTTWANDLALRQASTRRVLTGVQLVTGLTLTEVLLTLGFGLRAAGGPGWEWIDHVRHGIPADPVQVGLGNGAIGLGVSVLLASIVVAIVSMKKTAGRRRTQKDTTPTADLVTL